MSAGSIWNPCAPGQPLGLPTGADTAARADQRLMLCIGFGDQSIPADLYLPDRTAQGSHGPSASTSTCQRR